MAEVQLTAGPIEYTDSGGAGPVLIFLHGLVMDGTLFDPVVDDLRFDHRCVVPTLPLGAHRRPMRPDADLTLVGLGRLVGEFLDRLELADVTIVLNDHAAGLALAVDRPDRLARLVVSSCEAFDNYPPGLPGKVAGMSARLPGGIFMSMQLMRVRALRRLPIGLGWMSKRPLPHELTDRWFAPARADPAIRRDLRRYAASARKAQMVETTERLRGFEHPALVIWATEDRVMPIDHGRRLAELLPDARLLEVADSYTLIPRDQPRAFAQAVRSFVAETPVVSD